MQDLKEKVAKLFEDEKMSVFEAVNRLNVNEYEVLKHLDNNTFKEVSGSNLLKVLDEISTWGEILFCKNTPEFIIEFKTKIDPTKAMRGYHNFCGESGYLGGHLKEGAVTKIGFVSTKFMNTLGHSVHFYNDKNETIFKFYLARDENRNLILSQVEKFKALKESL